jgi:pimeloyl-ACP methyl ester carboxylesterase
MPEAESKNASIHYEVEGSGEPVVLAHLYPRDLNSWRQAGYVEALKDKYQLILIDSRGLGKSEKDPDPNHYEAEYRAKDVVAVLDDLGIQSAHYWGYSLGGRAGWCLAKYAPERVKSLILGGVEPSPDNSGFAGLIQRIKDAIANGQAAEQFPGNDPSALAACLGGLMTDPPFEDHMSHSVIPCLLYAGTADRFYAGSRKAALEVIPGAKFFELAELDHNQTFERSDLVVPHILDFLQAH